MKATESRSRNVVAAHKKGDDQDGNFPELSLSCFIDLVSRSTSSGGCLGAEGKCSAQCFFGPWECCSSNSTWRRNAPTPEPYKRASCYCIYPCLRARAQNSFYHKAILSSVFSSRYPRSTWYSSSSRFTYRVEDNANKRASSNSAAFTISFYPA